MLTLVEAALAVGFVAGVAVTAGAFVTAGAYRSTAPEPAPFIDRTRARRRALAPWPRQPAEIGASGDG